MNTHLVFDLDGTLSDTQKIHEKIESDFLKTKGVFIDPKVIGRKYAGRTPQEWITEVLREERIHYSVEEIEGFVLRKDETVIRLLKKGQIVLMPFAREILSYLHTKNYKIGISSGACREFIDTFISYFELEKIIISSTSANEVQKKKPHPDVFQKSFKGLEQVFGLATSKYVIGDGWSDVEGGYRAGAKTIWLNYSHKPRINNTYCNFQISTLQELQNIL